MSTIASPRQSIALTASRRTSASTDTTTSRSQSTQPAASSTSTVATAPSRRHRAALRDYYNIKSPASSTETDAVATLPTSPSEDQSADSLSTSAIDDPNLTAEEYISRFLLREPNTHDVPTATNGAGRDSLDTSKRGQAPAQAQAQAQGQRQGSIPGPELTLETLLRHEARLVTEIRGFDAERKALVYDNYSKLIHASDTIGRVMAGAGHVGAVGGVGAGIGPGVAPGPGTISDPASRPGLPGSSLSINTTDLSGATRHTAAMATLAPALAHIVETARQITESRGVKSADGARKDDKTVSSPTAQTSDPSQAQSTAEPQSPAQSRETPERGDREAKRATVRWVLEAPDRLEDLLKQITASASSAADPSSLESTATAATAASATATDMATDTTTATAAARPKAAQTTETSETSASAALNETGVRNDTGAQNETDAQNGSDSRNNEIKTRMQNEWARVSDLLDKWDGVKGVDELRAKCLRVMEQLT